MTTCSGKLFIRFTVRVLRKRLSMCVLFSLLVFKGGIWGLMVLVPDHCRSFYSALYKLITDPPLPRALPVEPSGLITL